MFAQNYSSCGWSVVDFWQKYSNVKKIVGFHLKQVMKYSFKTWNQYLQNAFFLQKYNSQWYSHTLFFIFRGRHLKCLYKHMKWRLTIGGKNHSLVGLCLEQWLKRSRKDKISHRSSKITTVNHMKRITRGGRGFKTIQPMGWATLLHDIRV